MKKHLLLTAGLVLSMSVVFAQNQISWGQITTATGDAETNILVIIRYAIGIVLGVGFLTTLYFVITGKSESKDKLGYFVLGLALYIIAMALNII